MATLALLAATAAAATPPHAIVAGSLGVPELLAAHVEVFVAEQWSIEAGARLGVGIAWGNVASGLKLEPAIEVVPVQVGLVF